MLILRRGDPDIRSTKFHEFQHYKNNSQLTPVNGQHPFDAIDIYFDQISKNAIAIPDLDKALQIVLMILWDETQGFQMDIACSTNPDFEINDQFVIDNFQDSYVPRFAGLRITNAQISEIYWSAKKNTKLAEFQNDLKIVSILRELNLQNQNFTSLGAHNLRR